MARISTNEHDSVYHSDDDDYYEDSINVVPAVLFIYFAISLFCIIGSLLCDIPVIIIQFVSTKVMNNIAFRTLVC